MKKILAIAFCSLLLTNCGGVNRSHFGAATGAVAVGGTCSNLTSDLVIVSTCAVIGSALGSELFWNDDMNTHYGVFVDQLNKSPNDKVSIMNWYNPKTKNSGIIRVQSTYIDRGLLCKDYDSTVDVSTKWPLYQVKRDVAKGTACQLPDGRWEIRN